MTGQSAYRGTYGEPRPPRLDRLPLPPRPMPSHWGARPLKAWRYVGVYGPELMLCVGAVRVGRARQAFWAVWDREHGRLHERTRLGRGRVELAADRVLILEPNVQIDIALSETAGVEMVCPSGGAYAWTRKQGGIAGTGTVTVDGHTRRLSGAAIVDDTAAYYERHTRWRWSAGVGRAIDGRPVAWNLVEGVNDPPTDSERTVWVDGDPYEPPSCRFAADLSSVDQLAFSAEAVRERFENRLVLRSRYRQPFGTFSGRLPGGPELADGYGVMEEHEAWW